MSEKCIKCKLVSFIIKKLKHNLLNILIKKFLSPTISKLVKVKESSIPKKLP